MRKKERESIIFLCVRYTGIFLKKLGKQQCEMILLCSCVILSTVNSSDQYREDPPCLKKFICLIG
jgi:hypothetical protein